MDLWLTYDIWFVVDLQKNDIFCIFKLKFKSILILWEHFQVNFYLNISAKLQFFKHKFKCEMK